MPQRRRRPALFAGLALICAALCARGASPGEGRPVERQEGARTDLYGDPLPGGAIARLGTTRLREVVAFALSADGKRLAATCRDRSLRVWSLTDGKELLRAPAPKEDAWAIAFSADGRLLATGDNGRLVRLWDAATGKEVRHFKGHGNYVSSVSFTPDGRLLASVDYDGLVVIWEVTGREVRRLDGNSGGLRAVFSPDGKTLAVGGHGRVLLYEADTGRLVRRIESSTDGAGALAFSADGKLLAACGLRDGPALWEVASGKELLRPGGDAGDRCGVAFTPDGKQVAFAVRVATGSGRLYLRAVATGEEVWRVEDPFAFTGMAFTSDGRSLVGANSDGSVCVLDAGTGREQLPFPAHRRPLTALAFSPNGRQIVAASAERTFRLWDAETGREVRRFTSSPRPVSLVAFTPDGKALVSAGPGDRIVRLWDADRGRELHHFSAAGEVAAVAVSPDGKTLAVAADRIIHLLDGMSLREQVRLKGHTDRVHLLAFAPDGRTLVSQGWDRLLRAWDLAGGAGASRVLYRWPAREEGGWAQRGDGLTFTPDGATLLFGVPAYRVEVIDRASGNELKFPKNEAYRGTSFALSPDGRLLALGGANGTVRVYETLTRALRRQFAGHREEVLALAFAPDSKRLASGGKDGQALVWELLGSPPQPWGLQRAWDSLGDPGGLTSFEAVGQLVALRGQAVAFLRKRLAPVPADLSERIAGLIADLDSKQYRVRERAATELAQLGEPAESALRQALAGMPSLEVRRRMEKILKDREGQRFPPELLRTLRAVEVLERIGNPEARAVLGALARGYPAARLTREARAALTRLDKQAAAR